MRTTILILFVGFTLFSCSNPYKDQIKTYVQTIDNIKTDLGFKVISLGELKSTYAKEILPTLETSLQQELTEELRNTNKRLENYIKEGGLEFFKKEIDSLVIQSEKIQKCFDRTDLGLVKALKSEVFNLSVETIEKYRAHPDSLINYRIKCTYSIINPLLGNVRQEITQVFVFDKNKKIQGLSSFKD
jgi:hypothetical protein